MRAYGSIAPRSVPVSEFRICRLGGWPGPHSPHRLGGGKCYHPAMPAEDWL